MPKKQGVCLNVGGCSKAKNRELQEAEISEFICAECGKPLKEKVGKKTGGNTKKKKIIAIAAAIAVIGAGTGIGLSLKNNQADKPESEPEVVADTVYEAPQPVDTTKKGPEKEEPKEPKIINPDFGKYDGPRNAAGKAHGLGGSVNVTKAYSLDLKDGNHTAVQLNPGDVIANTKFIDGKLVQGQLKRTDGTQKYLSIGN